MAASGGSLIPSTGGREARGPGCQKPDAASGVGTRQGRVPRQRCTSDGSVRSALASDLAFLWGDRGYCRGAPIRIGVLGPQQPAARLRNFAPAEPLFTRSPASGCPGGAPTPLPASFSAGLCFLI